MSDNSVFKVRKYICHVCKQQRDELAWNYDEILCCGHPMSEMRETRGTSALVIGDEIDEWCKHGICHADGSPRHFRSRAEKYRALKEKGLFINGETPK